MDSLQWKWMSVMASQILGNLMSFNDWSMFITKTSQSTDLLSFWDGNPTVDQLPCNDIMLDVEQHLKKSTLWEIKKHFYFISMNQEMTSVTENQIMNISGIRSCESDKWEFLNFMLCFMWTKTIEICSTMDLSKNIFARSIAFRNIIICLICIQHHSFILHLTNSVIINYFYWSARKYEGFRTFHLIVSVHECSQTCLFVHVSTMVTLKYFFD